MFEDFENWLIINTQQISIYERVKNFHKTKKKYSENFKIEIMESLVTLEKDPEWPIKLHLNTDLFSFGFQTIFMLYELQWQISKRWL